MDAIPADPFALAILGLAALIAAVLVLYGARELRLASQVLRSRPDSVLDATGGGPVELRGRAEPAGKALRAPFTGTPCLAYEYEVEEERSTKNGTTWRAIDSGDRYVPFLLDDGSGKILVEPPGASVRLSRDAHITVEGGTEPPERIARYIEATEDVDCQNTALDLRLFELKTGTDRRFTERRLDVGEEVHVLGTARYDTTVSRTSGQVNAAVGLDEAARSSGRWARLRRRLFGYPFVVSDRSERDLGVLAALFGIGAVLGAVLVVALPLLWLL